MPRIPVSFGRSSAQSRNKQGFSPFGDTATGTPQSGTQVFADRIQGEAQTIQELGDVQHERLKGFEEEFRGAITGTGEGIRNRIDVLTDPIQTGAAKSAEEIRERVRAEGTPGVLPEIRRRVAQQEARFQSTVAQQSMAATSGTAAAIDDEIRSLRANARAQGVSGGSIAGQVAELKARKNEALSRSLASAGVGFSQALATLNAQGTDQILRAATVEEGVRGRQNQQLAQAQALQSAADQIATSARLAGEQTIASLATLYPALGQMMASNPAPFVSEVAGMLAVADLAVSSMASGAGLVAINSAAGVPTEVAKVGVFGSDEPRTRSVIL